MSRDWQEDRNRWSYYLNHETTFASGFSIRSDIRRVSDRWYFRDFSPFNYYLDHHSQSPEERFRRVSFLGDESLGSLNSTVRLTKNWSMYNLTALASYSEAMWKDSLILDDFIAQNYAPVAKFGKYNIYKRLGR